MLLIEKTSTIKKNNGVVLYQLNINHCSIGEVKKYLFGTGWQNSLVLCRYHNTFNLFHVYNFELHKIVIYTYIIL